MRRAPLMRHNTCQMRRAQQFTHSPTSQLLSLLLHDFSWLTAVSWHSNGFLNIKNDIYTKDFNFLFENPLCNVANFDTFQETLYCFLFSFGLNDELSVCLQGMDGMELWIR